MLRIAYISDSDEPKPKKKTPKQEFIDRCKLLEANENYANKKKAEALFADKFKALEERKRKALEELKKSQVQQYPAR